MIDVAVVGCGHMGTLHARTVAAHPRCRLVAAVDVQRERAERLAGQYGGRALQTVPEQLDAVIVATPTSTHVDVAGPLVGRGVWCLVEKPLADSSRAGEALQGPRVRVGHSERYNPAVRAARIQGPLRAVQGVRRGPRRSRDTGLVLDLVLHDLDLLLWWTGGPLEVLGARLEEDDVHVGLSGEGLDVRLTAGLAVQRDRRLSLADATGAWELDLVGGRAWKDGHPVAPEDDRDALTAQLDALLAAMDGQEGGVSVDEALAALRLAEQIDEELRRPMCVG